MGMRGKTLMALGGSLVLGAAGAATAAQSDGEQGLQEEVQRLRDRVQELEAQQNEDWMTRRRAEEVKTLVRDVLSDADTRQSLLQEGMTAGHNGEHFYLSSADNSFLMELSGQVQVRHVNNFEGGDSAGDEEESGFEIRRAKIGVKGHVADPRVHYAFRLANDSEDGAGTDLDLEKAVVGYELTDNFKLMGGRKKAPFLREELTHSGKQLAVERSVVNEVFTLGYTEGVYFKWKPSNMVKFSGGFHDGIGSGETSGSGTNTGETAAGFDADNSDFAFTARGDVKLAGNWAQKKDFTAWSGEPRAVFVGGALHYEGEETGDPVGSPSTLPNTDGDDRFFMWTLDGSVEHNQWSLYTAAVGAHADTGVAGASDDVYGTLVQGAYNINDQLEPFVRWELIEHGANTGNGGNLLTFGGNYYIAEHDAKLSMDLVWAMDELSTAGFNGPGAGTGLLTDPAGGSDQLALRTQFQLLF
jgi:hypothetical protein